MGDLVRWLSEQLDEDERIAREATPGPWRNAPTARHHVTASGRSEEAVFASPPDLGATIVATTGEAIERRHLVDAEHIARHDPARVLREIDAKRQVLDLHAPEWDTVEWPHDQDGKGHAQVCRSCGNRDIDAWENWRPPVGGAGTLPEGVKPPYILAPCPTLRLLALPYADRPGYRKEWRP